MIVCGGYYREICVTPGHDDFFGSGGRAALALSLAGVSVDWHYYRAERFNEAQIKDTSPERLLTHETLTHHPYASVEEITFRYFHPLSQPIFAPAKPTQKDAFEVKGENILRFGFMEGDAKVHGDKVVFDPQSPHTPVAFGTNGSTAKSLAIVLNAKEVLALGGDENELAAIKNIQSSDNPDVILVKAGSHGCRVYEHGELKGTVPPYKTEKVYKIGSGDVFSAAFSYHWAEKGEAALEAAHAASRCTARYCNTLNPSAALDDDAKALEPIIVNREQAKIYVAGPFFTMSELWLVEEACAAFKDLGIEFFSPFHEVGLLDLQDIEDPVRRQAEIERTVADDLKGLDDCTAVFAIIDGNDLGTIFEIGYAVKKDLPIIALSQNPKEGDLTMIRGSKRCFVTHDFASAIYRAAWESWIK